MTYIKFAYLGGKNIVASFENIETGEKKQCLYFRAKFFDEAGDEREFFFDSVSIDFKAIQEMLFFNNILGIDPSVEVNEMPDDTFCQIGSADYVFGFKIKHRKNVYVFKSLSNLFPNFDYKKIDSDYKVAFFKAVVMMKESGLRGFTMAGACWNQWKKGHPVDVFGKRFNYIDWDKEMFCDTQLLGNFGLNMIDDKYQNKVVENVIDFDRNSQYPFIAVTYPLPTDQPKEFTSIKEFERQRIFETYFVKLKVYNAQLKEGLIPFINVSPEQNFNNLKVPRRMEGEIICLWKDEFEEFLKRYEKLSYKIMKVYGVKLKKGFFDDYFKPLFEEKERARNEKDYLSGYFAKSEMNMLLGKFAQNRYNQEKVEVAPYKFELFNSVDDYKYSLLFSYITMKSRMNEEYYANVVFRNQFVYCDTDSLFIKDFRKSQLKYIDIDKYRIGAFKVEDKCVEFAVKNLKQYALINDEGEVKNTIAGVDMDISETREPSLFVKGKHVYQRYQWDCSEFIPKKVLQKIFI